MRLRRCAAYSSDKVNRETTLLEDLGFDSLALTELLAALETKYGTIDPQELSACLTVADVEALAAIRDKRESRTRSIEGRQKPQARRSRSSSSRARCKTSASARSASCRTSSTAR